MMDDLEPTGGLSFLANYEPAKFIAVLPGSRAPEVLALTLLMNSLFPLHHPKSDKTPNFYIDKKSTSVILLCCLQRKPHASTIKVLLFCFITL